MMGLSQNTFARCWGYFKVYVHDFSAQIYATPNMDEFANKCIFLGGLQK